MNRQVESKGSRTTLSLIILNSSWLFNEVVMIVDGLSASKKINNEIKRLIPDCAADNFSCKALR